MRNISEHCIAKPLHYLDNTRQSPPRFALPIPHSTERNHGSLCQTPTIRNPTKQCKADTEHYSSRQYQYFTIRNLTVRSQHNTIPDVTLPDRHFSLLGFTTHNLAKTIHHSTSPKPDNTINTLRFTCTKQHKTGPALYSTRLHGTEPYRYLNAHHFTVPNLDMRILYHTEPDLYIASMEQRDTVTSRRIHHVRNIQNTHLKYHSNEIYS